VETHGAIRCLSDVGVASRAVDFPSRPLEVPVTAGPVQPRERRSWFAWENISSSRRMSQGVVARRSGSLANSPETWLADRAEHRRVAELRVLVVDPEKVNVSAWPAPAWCGCRLWFEMGRRPTNTGVCRRNAADLREAQREQQQTSRTGASGARVVRSNDFCFESQRGTGSPEDSGGKHCRLGVAQIAGSRGRLKRLRKLFQVYSGTKCCWGTWRSGVDWRI